MIEEQFRLEVLDWIANDPDPETASQLNKWLIENSEDELRKSFNGFLEFGTAGLRGIESESLNVSAVIYT